MNLISNAVRLYDEWNNLEKCLGMWQKISKSTWSFQNGVKPLQPQFLGWWKVSDTTDTSSCRQGVAKWLNAWIWGSDRPELESWPGHFLDIWRKESYLASLILHFPIWKTYTRLYSIILSKCSTISGLK